MRSIRIACIFFALAAGGLPADPVWSAETQPALAPSHGYSVFGELKYPADFSNYAYVNPDAPKGGELRMAVTGTFDSLNHLIVKGRAAAGLQLTYERLMAYAHDELGANYGLIAKSVTVAPDFSWVSFELRPQARWHDGKPITVEDVIFSFETIRDESSPVWRGFMTEITLAEKTGPHTVKFTFDGPDKHKLIYNIGALTILPKHYWQGRPFQETTMEPPLGSGPYRIASVDQGRSVRYERVEDYWAKDLAVNRGRHNFDEITYDYYRDVNSQYEAFKAGDLNYRIEYSASNWAKTYTFDAVVSGEVVKTAVRSEDPAWVLTYAPNMRLKKFQDRRVREAFNLAFDFDWLNKNFFHGLHTRTDSYFDSSSLGAAGLPSPEELTLLEPYEAILPKEMFETPFVIPKTDGSGNNRQNLVKAMKLLSEAGWDVTDGVLTNRETGEPFTAELLVNNTLMSRVGGPWIQALKKLGIKASIRQVDTSQYFNRISDFDFDIMVTFLPQNSLPGRELRDFWGSGAARRKGGLNFAGIEDEAVDAMLEIIATSNDQEEYFAAIRAVDRILLWNHYMVPMYHSPEGWRAHAKTLKFKPRTDPMYDFAFPASWWYEDDEDTLTRQGN